MNLYQFIENNPFVTVILACIIGSTIASCVEFITKAFKRKGDK